MVFVLYFQGRGKLGFKQQTYPITPLLNLSWATLVGVEPSLSSPALPFPLKKCNCQHVLPKPFIAETRDGSALLTCLFLLFFVQETVINT